MAQCVGDQFKDDEFGVGACRCGMAATIGIMRRALRTDSGRTGNTRYTNPLSLIQP
jgi:hypothetical protein